MWVVHMPNLPNRLCQVAYLAVANDTVFDLVPQCNANQVPSISFISKKNFYSKEIQFFHIPFLIFLC